MRTGPPFDPRSELSTKLLDLGPIRVSRRDASGGWVTTDERKMAMSVILDGAQRIDGGLLIDGDDTLVAFNECSSCDLWECNLVEGYAAKVRRIGPYVLWITAWDERYCFDIERYRAVFGGDVDALPELGADEFWDLDDPVSGGEYLSPDGRRLVLDAESNPEGPAGRLQRWPQIALEGLEAVRPPSLAIELKSAKEGVPSLWVDQVPRARGHRAVFLPGVMRVPVWVMGPDVDRLLADLEV